MDRLRQEKGLTQQQVGDAIGAINVNVGKFERTGTELSAAKISQLPGALGYTSLQMMMEAYLALPPLTDFPSDLSMKTLGAMVRILRNAREDKINSGEIARRIGVVRKGIWDFETNGKGLSNDKIARLPQALGYPTYEAMKAAYDTCPLRQYAVLRHCLCRLLRENADITLRAMAEKIGVVISVLHKFETEGTGLGKEKVAALLEQLGFHLPTDAMEKAKNLPRLNRMEIGQTIHHLRIKSNLNVV